MKLITDQTTLFNRTILLYLVSRVIQINLHEINHELTSYPSTDFSSIIIYNLYMMHKMEHRRAQFFRGCYNNLNANRGLGLALVCVPLLHETRKYTIWVSEQFFRRVELCNYPVVHNHDSIRRQDGI
jgi:hypothetical protein